MNEDLPLPDEIYVSPTPEIDFDKLMNLYGNGEEEEEMKKDKIFSDWYSVKIEFFSITTFIIELYISGMIVPFLFKRHLKLIDKVKQFTEVFEGKKEELRNEVKDEGEELYLITSRYPTKPYPLSHREEILNQWGYFATDLFF